MVKSVIGISPQLDGESKMKDLKLYCSVNKRKEINNLEDKANACGWLWLVPRGFKPVEPDFKGTDRGIRKSLITIDDFGEKKQTIKTEYVLKDGGFYKDTEYGIYNNNLASNFHGSKSINFKPRQLTMTEIVRTLHYGYSISAGLYDAEKCSKKSWRSQESLQSIQFILFDGDKWDVVEAPNSYEELAERYTDLQNDFFYIGESVSSRSDLKPELRFRFGLAFPEPIDCYHTYQVIVEGYCKKYPFLDPKVATDMARLSFGNGREDVIEKQFDNIMNSELFDQCKKKGSRRQWKQNLEEQNKQKRIKDQQDLKKLEKELIDLNLLDKPEYDYEGQNPYTVFSETVDVAQCLIENGHITDLGNGNYNWHESGSGVSLKITNDGVIKMFATTPKSYLPDNHNSESPINGHRFLVYLLYQIDIKGASKEDKKRIYQKLASDGYGIYTDERQIRKRNRDIQLAAAKAQKINANDLKRAESRLKVEKEKEIKLNESLTTIENNQDAILDFIKSDKEVLGLISETGAGKTEQALRDDDKKTFLVPTIELAQEIENRATRMEKDAMAWRARDYKFDEYCEQYPTLDERIDNPFKEGSVCIQADICNRYASKGGEVRSLICPHCPVFEQCKIGGYLSQLPILKESQVQIIANQDLFTNPEWEGWADELLTREQPEVDDEEEVEAETDPRTAIIDEAKGYDFFIKCQITRQRLEDIATMWKGKEAGNFAIQLLETFEDIEEMRKVVESLSKQDISKINKQLGTLRLPIASIEHNQYYEPANDEPENPEYNLKVQLTDIDNITIFRCRSDEVYEWVCENKDVETAVIPAMTVDKDYLELSIAQAVKGRIFRLENEEEYFRLPPVEKNSKFTFVNKLVKCFEYYKQVPMVVENNMLTFYCPPVKHKKLHKLIAMSATLNNEHLKRAFPDVDLEVYKTNPTPFVEGAELYQIDTGKYTANSLLEPDQNSFTRTGLTFLEEIEKKIAADIVNKYAIITSKRIIELRTEVWEKLPNPPITANFGAAAGMDTKYKDVNRIIVLGSFEIPPPEIMLRAKILYGNDEEQLSADREVDHLNNMVYTDQRVKGVYESQTIGELIQCIGRARLNREAKKVYVFSGHYIQNYTERSIKFDSVDLQVADNFDELAPVAMAYRIEKEKKERQHNKRLAIAEDLFWSNRGNISINEVTERTGLTRNQVQRVFQQKIKPSLVKDDTQIDDFIKQDLQKGIAQKDIIEKYGVSANRVRKNKSKGQPVDILILKYLTENGICTLVNLVDGLKISKSKIQRNLTALIKENKINREGKGKYKIIP